MIPPLRRVFGISAISNDCLQASTFEAARVRNSTPLLLTDLHRRIARLGYLLQRGRTAVEMGSVLLSYLGPDTLFTNQHHLLERELPRPFLTAWHPLPDSSSPALLRTLYGHSLPVESCAISGDGRLIVSAAWDGTLKIWDVTTGEERYTLQGHSRQVWSCAISGDSRFIVSSSVEFIRFLFSDSTKAGQGHSAPHRQKRTASFLIEISLDRSNTETGVVDLDSSSSESYYLLSQTSCSIFE